MSLRQLQRYEILSELSRGGMGAIYAARDPNTGAELAIKTILGPLTDKARARFEREALALAQISHPNIIPIHSYGVHDNVPYLVMPRISGQDWASHIAQAQRHNGLPPLELSLSVHAQIADALAWLHERGLAHRDVKPANILLEDETKRAILIDFGLVLTDSSEELTRTGELIGSLPYLPPEAFDDKARRSPAAMDVWSLSVSLYQSLAGELPFQARGAELIAKIINSQPRSLNRSAPRSIAALVARGLDKDPLRRPTARALEAILSEPLSPPRLRWPLILGLLLTALTLLIFLFFWSQTASLDVEPVLELTSQSRLTLRGRYSANSLQIESPEGRVDWPQGAGDFELEIPLREGSQTIRVLARPLLFGEPLSRRFTVTRDSEPPALELEDPPKVLFRDALRLKGEFSEEGCRILNPEIEARAKDRRVQLKIPLKQGRQEIQLDFVDAAGNRGQASFSITRATVLRVGASGDFQNLTSALESAPPIAEIIVDAGNYVECAIARGDRDLSIRAAEPGKVHWNGLYGPPLILESGRLKIEGISLLGPGDLTGNALEVRRGRLEMKDCSLSFASAGIGVLLQSGGGELRLHRTRIVGSGLSAVQALGDCRVIARDTLIELRGIGKTGKPLTLKDGASLQMTNCQIKGGSIGMLVESHGPRRGTVELTQCEISGSDHLGIRLEGQTASASLDRCQLSQSERGIELRGGSSLEARDLSITKMKISALELQWGEARLERGAIEDCGSWLLLARSSQSRLQWTKGSFFKSGPREEKSRFAIALEDGQIELRGCELYAADRRPYLDSDQGSISLIHCKVQGLSRLKSAPGLRLVSCESLRKEPPKSKR